MTPTTSPTSLSPSPMPQPRTKRYSVRFQARLDADTSAQLIALAKTLHRRRGPILRYVLQWGLTHSKDWIIGQTIPASVHLVHVLVEPALMAQVQEAAARHGTSVAAWVRCALRQVTQQDFPASWPTEEMAPRSHESGYFRRKFGLRLDESTSQTLEALTKTFHRSAAEVVRQLIVQAKPEDFPRSWQLAAEEPRQRETPSGEGA
jgi:hypothetical protein